MRALRPDRLLVLASGLWAVDEFQPVAAVLDPATGAVRRVVSWSQLPPAPSEGAFGGRSSVVLGDGSSLWTQQHALGPLLRITADGPAAAVWTDELELAACGPGVAWCAPRPPQQELVRGAGALPSPASGPDRLLRVAADGRCTPVHTDRRVRSVRAEADALLVRVDVEDWELRHLGVDDYEVVRATRWLALPWDAPVPDELGLATHALPDGDGPVPRDDVGGRLHLGWHAPDPPSDADRVEQPPVLVGGLRWHLGWSRDASPGWRGRARSSVATAHDDAGRLVRSIDLGRGTVVAATALGDRLAVAVRRDADVPTTGSPVEVLALDPGRDGATVLLGPDAVDVTDGCWPLVPRPLDADSYAGRVMAAHDSLDTAWVGEGGSSGPLATGMSGARSVLSGDWPDTHLEWTFAFADRPGLLLRRRVPLFDELGRLAPPVHADIHLMEDLETGVVPPAAAARDGVLDV